MTTLRLAVATALACGMVVSAFCPVARAGEGEVSFGSQWWDQTVRDAKYDEFSQVPRGGFLESFVLREWSGRNSLALWGANGLRSDQASKLTWANGARWRVDLGYTQIPHQFSHTARWGWTQTAPGVFTLPDTLQARNQALPTSYTPRMADFLADAPTIKLGFDTHISNARLRARPARGWQFEARGTMRERSGQKPYALDFGFSTALENPEPINQRMVDADLIASYQRSRLRAQASVGLSTFDNAISTLIVDNPKRNFDTKGGDGPRVGQLDLYPDNQVVRGSLALSYLLPKRTAIAATLGIAQGKQDDDFLPFTTNTLVDTIGGDLSTIGNKTTLDSLAARRLDGKTTQLNGDVRLTTSPVRGLDGTLRFHYTDYDDRTEERNWIGQTPYDVTWQRFIELESGPHGNTQWQGGVDADYAFASQFRLGVIAEYRSREREEREVEKDHETVLGGRTRLRPWDGFEVSGRYTHGDRKLDEFLGEDYIGLRTRFDPTAPGLYDSLGQLEQPDLRRFDVANRVQDLATVGASYAFGERLDLSASYDYLKNDYKDTKFGLQDETQHTAAANATWHFNDQVDLDWGGGYSETETNQASRQSGSSIPSTSSLDDWGADLKDRDGFAAAGFEWTPKGRISLSGRYQLSVHDAKFDLSNATSTAQDLPTTIYRRHESLLDASWRWLESTTVVGRWGWEEYDVDDWATNDVPLIFPVTGTATAIFLGDSARSYKAHRVALLVKHRF
ncbi:MAG TPA: MtrB/PioB family outer membrane beta-barrel protein [Candidatus Eisenbacteria bacterium]